MQQLHARRDLHGLKAVLVRVGNTSAVFGGGTNMFEVFEMERLECFALLTLGIVLVWSLHEELRPREKEFKSTRLIFLHYRNVLKGKCMQKEMNGWSIQLIALVLKVTVKKFHRLNLFDRAVFGLWIEQKVQRAPIELLCPSAYSPVSG